MPAFDQIVVVDLEATCWEGEPPTGETSEIIEIGVSLLRLSSLEVGEGESILVRPERSNVSEFCAQLTTLTQADVEGGISLSEACTILRKRFDARNRVWASFGDYDRRMFERSCKAIGLSYPFGPSHINVKTLYATAFGRPTAKGMPGVLAELGLPHFGTHHRGHDDAFNIAHILAKIFAATRAGGFPAQQE